MIFLFIRCVRSCVHLICRLFLLLFRSTYSLGRCCIYFCLFLATRWELSVSFALPFRFANQQHPNEHHSELLVILSYTWRWGWAVDIILTNILLLFERWTYFRIVAHTSAWTHTAKPVALGIHQMWMMVSCIGFSLSLSCFFTILSDKWNVMSLPKGCRNERNWSLFYMGCVQFPNGYRLHVYDSN